MLDRLLSGLRAFAPVTLFALVAVACSVKSETDSSDIGAYAPCQPNENLECSGADGYSCSGGSSPATSSLACAAQDSDGNFCCVSFSSTTCTQDDAAPDCPTGVFEFTCSGTDDPTSGNESIDCNARPDDSTIYCCTF